MSTNKNGFLPDGYEVPSGGGGGYTKLEQGETRLRILSAPLFMWIVWEDGKVKRLAYAGKESKPDKPTTTPKDSVKHAWAVIVYNYKTKQIEIFEIDKASIQNDIVKYSNDTDYGHPKNYDLKITKSGSGMDTEYATIAAPPNDPSDELVEAFTACPINLDNLLEGKDPFLANAGKKENTAPATTKEKVVTADNWVKGDALPKGYKEEGGKLVKKSLPF